MTGVADEVPQAATPTAAETVARVRESRGTPERNAEAAQVREIRKKVREAGGEIRDTQDSSAQEARLDALKSYFEQPAFKRVRKRVVGREARRK